MLKNINNYRKKPDFCLVAAEKCVVLYFGKNNQRTPYFLNEQQIPATDYIRDLGVMVDHILNACRQSRQRRLLQIPASENPPDPNS